MRLIHLTGQVLSVGAQSTIKAELAPPFRFSASQPLMKPPSPDLFEDAQDRPSPVSGGLVGRHSYRR